MRYVDADMHLYEPRGMWREYADPAARHLALELTDDDLGHTWLTLGGERVHIAEVHHPGDVPAMGAYRQRLRHGQPPEMPYDEALPREFVDPALRAKQVEQFGLEAAVVFPNFGLLWERPLAARPDVQLANMTAWNRWCAVIAAEGGGRLNPVAHLSLRDLDWLERELSALSGAGIKLAMIAPSLVDGKRLSHPDLDRAWSLFETHAVTPVFHIAAFPLPFDEAWYDSDFDLVNPVLSSIFLWTPAALSLADLALHGVFERHPNLRMGVMELSAMWVPQFLLMLDGGFGFHATFNGEPFRELPLRPAEYIQRQVRIAAFGYEMPGHLINQIGPDVYMFCSDYPHAEGIKRPVDDYVAMAGEVADDAAEKLYSGNLEFLLHA